MPHINIKHFPKSLTKEKQTELASAITQIITNIFQCDEKVVSIALQPIEKESWNEAVYVPEIINRKELLCKTPNY